MSITTTAPVRPESPTQPAPPAPQPPSAPEVPSAGQRPPARPNPARKIIAMVLAALVVMLTFAAVFLAAFHSPRPNRVPVAFVGTSSDAGGVQARVNDSGRGTLHVVAVGSAEQAVQAVRSQRVRAAVVPGPDGPRLITASAASVQEADAVHDLLTGALGPLTVQDVAPLPGGDRKGLSTVFAAFGMTIVSFAFGAALAMAGRRAPTTMLLAGLAGLSLLAGAGVVVVADPLVGALGGAFWPLAGVAVLLVLAVSAAVCGLGRLAGPAGVALGALVLVMFGISSAGGPLGYDMLPDFYRAISQALPTGAAMTAIRRVVYFDDARVLPQVLVLETWAVGGALAVAAGPYLARRRRAA